MRFSHARRPRQLIEHIDQGVVRDEQRVELPAFAIEHEELQDGGRALLHRQPLQLDLRRQVGHRGLHAVVDVDRVDVRVRPELKADREIVRAMLFM